jgi:hypothetical protein
MQLLKIPEVLNIKCGKRIDPELPWPFFIAIDFESMDKYAIFDASPEVRLQRRAAQGERDEIAIRDRADSLRLVSPLVIAKDAHVIDTSHLTIQEVIDEIIGLLKKMALAI